MLLFLYNAFQKAIDGSWFSFFSIIDFVSFRTIMAVIIGFALVVGCGKPIILWLTKQKIGDNPEFDNADLNALTKDKKNVPTMGGIIIILSVLVTVLLLGDLGEFYIRMGIVCLIGCASVGIADDWLKLTAARRNPGDRDGLRSWEKMLFLTGLSVILGIFIYNYGVNKYYNSPALNDMSASLNLPGLKSWVNEGGQWIKSPSLVVLPIWAFVMVAWFTITGASNAVNLTDGMDGLASGISTIVCVALAALCIIAGHDDNGRKIAQHLLVPHIPNADELAVLAAAMAGACLGFLWYNCHPAKVFMGDTGSLALGGTLGYIAVVTRQEILLGIIGGVFVIEVLSVVLQVGCFKLTGGRRIFRCAPIHHHFHLGGWSENQVVVRAWIVTVLLAAIALATIKLR